MQIQRLTIKNFKSIRNLTITDIEETLVLVGKNNVGKSAVIDAVKIVASEYEPKAFDFRSEGLPILVEIALRLDDDDLFAMFLEKKISDEETFEAWFSAFKEKLPTYENDHLTIFCKVTLDGLKTYSDANGRNPFIVMLLPNLYILNEKRDLNQLHDALIVVESKAQLDELKGLDEMVMMPEILEKKSEDLSLLESLILVKYKFYKQNLEHYTDQVNRYFKGNYGKNHVIEYDYQFDVQKLLEMKTVARNLDNGYTIDIYEASNSMKSLYIFSLFQAYIALKERSMNIFIVEQPELHLHPELQKITADILFKLSKKNQIIFTTHSPTMIQNYSETQIRQVGLNEDHQTVIIGPTDVDRILEDLGQSANDLMNVNFVFIVEGKDDRSKLPMVLEKFYSEVRREDGELNRIAIIPTNSCTNIQTYANLKFINKTFLKDNFMIIRDSDGRNREALISDLTTFYDQRRKQDEAQIPRIKAENVLILKYYSIENYFLDPEILLQLGMIKSVESFYEILYSKYTQSLFKLRSAKQMKRETGLWFDSAQDIKANIETIKIYIRGHNLFEIYYGNYPKKRQKALMKAYIDLAPREVFADILDAIESFVYFENRRKKETSNG